MIRFLKHNEIDKRRWDDCISHSTGGIIYAFSWYLDIVSKNWCALVEDNYSTVFPLTAGKKGIIHYILQPLLAQQLGVFSQQKITNRLTDEFLAAIPEKYRLIDIKLNTHCQTENQQFTIIHNVTYELNLKDQYNLLRERYSTNCRRNIHKAEKAGLVIIRDGIPEDIIALFKRNQGQKLRGIKEENYLMLKKVIDTGNERKLVQSWSIFNEKKEICAGVFFIKSIRKAVFLFSATNEEARGNGAMFLLIDTFISENAGKELTLDFEGSNVLSLARFYSGFGAKPAEYLQVKRNTLPWAIRKTMYLMKYIPFR